MVKQAMITFKQNMIIKKRTQTCSSVGRETGVQSQVESCQRLKKWYLTTPCLTISIIRYVSRVKWSNPGNGVAPSPTAPSPVVAIEKGAFELPSTMVVTFTFYTHLERIPQKENIPTNHDNELINAVEDPN